MPVRSHDGMGEGGYGHIWIQLTADLVDDDGSPVAEVHFENDLARNMNVTAFRFHNHAELLHIGVDRQAIAGWFEAEAKGVANMEAQKAQRMAHFYAICKGQFVTSDFVKKHWPAVTAWFIEWEYINGLSRRPARTAADLKKRRIRIIRGKTDDNA